MATETVIYVSLALVLLTRIYVFISPPEFLEEHKDRRYHEYHLYRQYHIHKQTDKNEQQEDQNDSSPSMPSSSRRRSDADRESSMSTLDELHRPSHELVLLGRESGARPFPLQELSILDPAAVMSPTSASPISPQESERGIWHHILGSSGANPVPNYISLDISEIHYNGSLKKFHRDLEVLESIRELKAGLRDMAKECPTMTMIWEGGRWCCLEGRTLYILKALEWKGQVRVRVLVDKDPMTLAVTEDDWKATGMVPELKVLSDTATSHFSQSAMMPISPISPLVSPTDEADFGKQALRAEWEAAIDAERYEDDNNKNNNNNHIRTSAASTSSAVTVELSLDDDRAEDMGYSTGRRGAAVSSQLRSSLLISAEPSLPGSPAGHEADDEDEEDNDEAASDGYMEDDEDEDEDDKVTELKRRLEALDISRKPSRRQLAVFPRRRESTDAHGGSRTGQSSSLIWTAMPQQQQQYQQQRPTKLAEEDENISNLRVVSPPSPLLLPSSNLDMLHSHISRTDTTTRPQKLSFGTVLPMQTKVQHQHLRQHHERKISIPEFMLPPPLYDEQPYVIVDPAPPSPNTVRGNLREITPRRDSGHGDGP